MLYKIVLHCKLLSSEGDTWLDELVNKGVKKKKREAFAGNNNHCRLVHWLQKQKQKQSLLVFSCEMHVPLVAKQHEEALRGVPARGVIGRSLQSLPGAWIRASWMGNTFVCLAVVLTKCVCVWTERQRKKERERMTRGEQLSAWISSRGARGRSHISRVLSTSSAFGGKTHEEESEERLLQHGREEREGCDHFNGDKSTLIRCRRPVSRRRSWDWICPRSFLFLLKVKMRIKYR